MIVLTFWLSRSRTGTTSLGNALKHLLGPVHDSGTYVSRGTKKQQTQWLEAVSLALPNNEHQLNKQKATKPAAHERTLAETKRVEYLLASLLEGYSATMDVPACLLTPELLALYPNAVVIVTTRDSEAWFKSQQLIDDLNEWWTRLPLLLYFIPKLNILPRWLHLRRRLFRWRFGKDRFTEAADLTRHETWLRGVVPKERLFFFSVKDGWGPLCEILDVPVPDTPFPNHNDANTVKRDFLVVVAAASFSWAAVLGTVGAISWQSWKLYNYR